MGERMSIVSDQNRPPKQDESVRRGARGLCAMSSDR